MTVEQTLEDLVAIDSVSSRSNAPIISYLKDRCERLGFQIQQFPHVDENGVKISKRYGAVPPTDVSGTLQIALRHLGIEVEHDEPAKMLRDALDHCPQTLQR